MMLRIQIGALKYSVTVISKQVCDNIQKPSNMSDFMSVFVCLCDFSVVSDYIMQRV